MKKAAKPYFCHVSHITGSLLVFEIKNGEFEVSKKGANKWLCMAKVCYRWHSSCTCHIHLTLLSVQCVQRVCCAHSCTFQIIVKIAKFVNGCKSARCKVNGFEWHSSKVNAVALVFSIRRKSGKIENALCLVVVGSWKLFLCDHEHKMVEREGLKGKVSDWKRGRRERHWLMLDGVMFGKAFTGESHLGIRILYVWSYLWELIAAPYTEQRICYRATKSKANLSISIRC